MDEINHPSHYCEGRECEPVEVLYDWDLDHWRATAVKYIARAGRKEDTIKDLKKAIFYLTFIRDKGVPANADIPERKFHLLQVLNDWGLSMNLRRALVAIYDSRNVKNDSMHCSMCVGVAIEAIEWEIMRIDA